jgi:hypothetical protein
MRKLTIYMWGYWGWGNAAPELVKAVDAVERKRGFKPPVFVDIRMKRSARPAVFRGNAFGQVVGPARYETMSALGNEHYLDDAKKRLPHSNRKIVIHDPTAADLLLDRAVELKKQNRHVIYFCACAFPNGNVDNDGEFYACHRSAVSSLLLKCARVRGMALEVVEWPGGGGNRFDMAASPETLKSVRRGRKLVPISSLRSLANWAETPWGSLIRLHCGDDELMIITGPAKFKQEAWALPVLDWGEPDQKAKMRTKSKRWRCQHGVDAVCA